MTIEEVRETTELGDYRTMRYRYGQMGVTKMVDEIQHGVIVEIGYYPRPSNPKHKGHYVTMETTDGIPVASVWVEDIAWMF